MQTSEKLTASHFKKPTVVINTGSGNTTDVSADILTLFDAFDMTPPEVYVITPDKLGETLKTVAEGETDLLVMLGGDGSCMAGAVAAREKDIVFIPLPGGTMNILPRALYGTADWRLALETALSQQEARWQCAGNLEGHVFFCAALIGDPTVMSQAREDLREGDIAAAAQQLPDVMNAISHGGTFSVKVDGKIFDKAANGLQISAPYNGPSSPFPDSFEVATAPNLSLMQLLSLGALTLATDWRASPDILVTEAKAVTVLGNGDFDVLLDGEPIRAPRPFTVKLEPKGVRVLAPQQSDEHPLS